MSGIKGEHHQKSRKHIKSIREYYERLRQQIWIWITATDIKLRSTSHQNWQEEIENLSGPNKRLFKIVLLKKCICN